MQDSSRITPVDLIVAGSCIVAVLLTVGAVGETGRHRAREFVCLSNVKQLSHAWRMYAEDNGGRLVGGHTVEYPVQWVAPLSPPANIKLEMTRIRAGVLFPYVGDVRVYHCPADQRVNEAAPRAFRSYSIPGGANGEEWANQHVPVERYTEITTPESTYVFVEEADPRHFNIGSWQIGFRPQRWIDPLAMWHGERTTLGFADGHSESHKWRNSSLIDWCRTAMYGPASFAFYMTPPADEREDLEYMAAGFPRKSEDQ